MKIEIRCPECSETYLVEQSSLPSGGGQLPCVGCGASIGVGAESRGGAGTTSAPASSSTGRPGSAGAAASGSGRGVARGAGTGSGRGGEEVVCPRCHLHFVPRRSHAEAAEAARPGDRHVVLVVEDMEYFLEIARDSLGGMFEVRCARTLDEARAEIGSGDVDLMIVDLMLEGSDQGRLLLAEQRPKRFPILVFTAQDEADMLGEPWQELQAMGADDVVLKGMNVGEVLLRKAADLLGVEIADDDLPD